MDIFFASVRKIEHVFKNRFKRLDSNVRKIDETISLIPKYRSHNLMNLKKDKKRNALIDCFSRSGLKVGRCRLSAEVKPRKEGLWEGGARRVGLHRWLAQC